MQNRPDVNDSTSPSTGESPAYPGPPFDPSNVGKTGAAVLASGLPDLPAQLSNQMAIPVSSWTDGTCGVVSFLRSREDPEGKMASTVRPVFYTSQSGEWAIRPGTYQSASGFMVDAVAHPELSVDPSGRALVYGHTMRFPDGATGLPSLAAWGHATPDVAYIAVIAGGHEDRRPLRCHFGIWTICTTRTDPVSVAAFDTRGHQLASLRHPFSPPRRKTWIRSE